jgi:hypothetical protein
LSQIVNIHFPGTLADAQEYQLGPFTENVTVTGFSPHCLVAPSGGSLVVRVQDATGASPANNIQATITTGNTILAAAATGTFTITAGNAVYIRVVTASSAEFLGGFVQINGLTVSSAPSGFRTRRQWTAMLAEIRRILREPTAASSYWADADLLDMFNRSIDIRTLDLQDAHEGWVTTIASQNIVADQVAYTIPEGAGRIKRVVYKPDTGGASTIEIPLVRNERFQDTLVTNTGTGGGNSGSVPTYRILGNQIQLEPPPKKAVTNGLQLECENIMPRIVNGADLLSLYFPDSMETMLIYDTAVEAMVIEASMGNLTAETYLSSVIRQRDAYESRFLENIQVRSFGPVYGPAYSLGG